VTFSAVMATLTTPSWLAAPQELIQHKGTLVLTKNESRQLLDEAGKAIDAADRQTAENKLYAGLLLDEERFLASLQRRGLFRLSRHWFVAEPLAPLVLSLLQPDIGLSPVVTDYLHSVRNLHRVAESIRHECDELHNWLGSERERGIRGVLGTLDFLFLKRTFELCPSDPALPSRDAHFFSAEQLGDGFSTILALYFREFGPLRGNVPIDALSAAKGEYVDYLIAGTHIAECRDWEFLVDRFGYRVTDRPGSNVFRLVPSSDEQHRAMEFGYIQDYMQRSASSHDWHDADVPSFVELGKRVADKVAVFVESPFPRYRFEFPEPLVERMLHVDSLTQDEQKTVTCTCREMGVSSDELFRFDVGEGLTFGDLFRVSRILSFMHGVSAAKLREEYPKSREIVFNSLVPSLTRDTLRTLLGQIVGPEKVEAAINLLSARDTGHVDILYTPLLPAGESVLVPLHIAAHANVYRNVLFTANKRMFEDGTHDPLSKHVAGCFTLAGAKVRTHVKYNWNGEEGEIDVLACLDDKVFVCECKNSLLPTGMHELRTSLDHINTAAGQLSRFLSCWQDNRFKKWLNGELGKWLDGNERCVPAILVSNRMFLGLRISSFPVRGNYELEHFVNSATVEMGGEKVCFWQGKSLTSKDLLRFFEEDVTYKPQWDAMEQITSRFEFAECSVETPRFRLNGIVLAGCLGLDRVKNEMLRMAGSKGLAVDNDGWLFQGTGDGATEGGSSVDDLRPMGDISDE